MVVVLEGRVWHVVQMNKENNYSTPERKSCMSHMINLAGNSKEPP